MRLLVLLTAALISAAIQAQTILEQPDYAHVMVTNFNRHLNQKKTGLLPKKQAGR